MSDLISVIVPVYNSGQFLSRCVDSILNQDYKNLEIIIVDDGSNDGLTYTTCDSLREKSSSIRVYHKENGGSASARNYGIKRAKGKFLGFVDSDDIIEPSMYSSLYEDAINHNVKIVLGNISTEENGRLIDKIKAIPAGEYDNLTLLHYFFLGHWHSACTNLYASDLFDPVFFPEGEVNEDYMLNYWLFKEQGSVYYNDTPFYHYLRRKGSNTSSPVTLKFLDWLKHTSTIRMDLCGNAKLKDEIDYQYLLSNIVLGNKCLVNLARESSPDAIELFKKVTHNLKAERANVRKNRFLNKRYRTYGILLAYVPQLYKYSAILILRVKKS